MKGVASNSRIASAANENPRDISLRNFFMNSKASMMPPFLQ